MFLSPHLHCVPCMEGFQAWRKKGFPVWAGEIWIQFERRWLWHISLGWRLHVKGKVTKFVETFQLEWSKERQVVWCAKEVRLTFMGALSCWGFHHCSFLWQGTPTDTKEWTKSALLNDGSDCVLSRVILEEKAFSFWELFPQRSTTLCTCVEKIIWRKNKNWMEMFPVSWKINNSVHVEKWFDAPTNSGGKFLFLINIQRCVHLSNCWYKTQEWRSLSYLSGMGAAEEHLTMNGTVYLQVTVA